MMNSTDRPLHGLRVLDLTVALAGPYASLLLGGMGAEVIHVEAPGGSDLARGNPPSVGKDGLNFGASSGDEISLSILNRGRNKKSITLDLKSEKGRKILLSLAATCDVFLENLSDGVVSRLKVDYDHVRQINPRIVYASIKAFGDPNGYPNLKGMDIVVQALSGIMDATGFPDGPPTRVGIPIADMVTPMYLVQGILAALIQRGRTGEGQYVQVSMLDALASLMAIEHFDVLTPHGAPARSGNFMDRAAPFGVFPSKDGYVAIMAFRQDWLTSLLQAMGRPDLIEDARFATRTSRMQHAAILNALIQEWTMTKDSKEIVHELLEQREVPAAKVRSPHEVLQDPLLHQSGALTRLLHPAYGDTGAVGMGLPIRFSKSRVQFDQPATELGAANEEIYGGLLGMSFEEIEQLRADGTI